MPPLNTTSVSKMNQIDTIKMESEPPAQGESSQYLYENKVSIATQTHSKDSSSTSMHKNQGGHVESDADSGIVALCSSIGNASGCPSSTSSTSSDCRSINVVSPDHEHRSHQSSSSGLSSSQSSSNSSQNCAPKSISGTLSIDGTAPANESLLKRSNSTGCLDTSQSQHHNLLHWTAYPCSASYTQLVHPEVAANQPEVTSTIKSSSVENKSPTGSEYSVQFTEQQMRVSCQKLLATLQPEPLPKFKKPNQMANNANNKHCSPSANVINPTVKSINTINAPINQCTGQCMADKVIYENAQVWIEQQQKQKRQKMMDQTRNRANSCFETTSFYQDNRNCSKYLNHYQQPRTLNVSTPEMCNCTPVDYVAQHVPNTYGICGQNGQLGDHLIADSVDELQQVLLDGQLIQQAIKNLSESQRQQNSEQIRQLLLTAIQQKTLEKEHLEREEAQLQQRLLSSHAYGSNLQTDRYPFANVSQHPNVPTHFATLPRRDAVNGSNTCGANSKEKPKVMSQLVEKVDPLESTESMVNAFASVALIDNESFDTTAHVGKPLVQTNFKETWVDGLDRIGSKGVSIRSINQNTMLRTPSMARNRGYSCSQLQRISEHDSSSNLAEDNQSIAEATPKVPASENYVIEVTPTSQANSLTLNDGHEAGNQVNAANHNGLAAKLVVRKMSNLQSRPKAIKSMSTSGAQCKHNTSAEIEYAEIMCQQQQQHQLEHQNHQQQQPQHQSQHQSQQHQPQHQPQPSSQANQPSTSCSANTTIISNASTLNSSVPSSDNDCHGNVTYDQVDGPMSTGQVSACAANVNCSPDTSEHVLTQSCYVPARGPNKANQSDDSFEDDLITKSYHGGYCSRQTSEILKGTALKKNSHSKNFLHRFGLSLSRAFARAFHSEVSTSNKGADANKVNGSNMTCMSMAENTTDACKRTAADKHTSVPPTSDHNDANDGRPTDQVDGCDPNALQSHMDRSPLTSSLKPVEMSLHDFCIINRPSVAASAKRLVADRSGGSVVGSRVKQRTCSVKRAGQSSGKASSTIGCNCRRCVSSNVVRKRNSTCKRNASIIQSAAKTNPHLIHSKASTKPSAPDACTSGCALSNNHPSPRPESKDANKHNSVCQSTPTKIVTKSSNQRKLRWQDELTIKSHKKHVVKTKKHHELQTEDQVVGELLELHRDGSLVIQLKREKGQHFGFFVARGKVNNVNGVFVSRMRDKETQKLLNGLLEVGDEIVAIDHVNVKNLHILEVNALMTSKNKIKLRVLPFVNNRRN